MFDLKKLNDFLFMILEFVIKITNNYFVLKVDDKNFDEINFKKVNYFDGYWQDISSLKENISKIQEFQIASFNLKKNEIILNHYHPKQERKIFNTSEMITLLEGKIKIKIFKNDNTLVHSEILKSGDSVAMFDGGHGIEIIEDSKFIESKQGPFSEDNDKIRF